MDSLWPNFKRALYDFDEEINGWSMSRFMIDQHHQHNGYGKVAIQEFLEYFETNIGNADLYTSAEVENTIAIHLYQSFGFIIVDEFSYESHGTEYREVRMLKKANEKERRC